MRSGELAIMSRTRWSPARAMSGPMSMMTSRSSCAACSAANLIAMRPAHRVADEREAAQAQAAREGGHVVGHRAHPVVVVGGGIAVAVPALVEREHAPGRRQALGEVVPHPRVPGDAV